MSFFDEFTHLVPYFVKVSVGKDKAFKTDPSKRSDKNYKGKMIAVNKKSTTIEELAEYGMGEHTVYIPAEEVSMPIDIKVVSDEKIKTMFEKTSKYTNKEMTFHTVRVFDKDNNQIGYVSFSLSPSGDIKQKTSFYENPDRTEMLEHIIYSEIKDGVNSKDDIFQFTKHSEQGTKKVQINQRDGRLVGASILEQELETPEDVQFQSITQFSKDENTPKIRKYIASCVADETDRKKRGGTLIPWECMTLEDDLLDYQNQMDEFERYSGWIKESSGLEMTLKNAKEIMGLSYKKKQELGIPSYCDTLHCVWLANYLSDENNNLLKDFRGSYIGNILRLTDNGYEACIVTKHEKGGQDHRLYTLIDLTGTSITKGTGIAEGDRDGNYLERLRTADKTPAFVTRVGKDGKEELVLYKGNAVSGECPEYEEFVANFIAPFAEIKPMQISQILNKENQQEK